MYYLQTFVGYNVDIFIFVIRVGQRSDSESWLANIIGPILRLQTIYYMFTIS